MANTDLISVSLVDENGNRGHVHIYVPTGMTLAQLQAFADAALPDIDAVSGAKIDSVQVTKQLTLVAGLKASATAGHPIQQGANVSFDALNTAYRHTIRIPAVLESLCTGDVFNVASGAGATFATQITTGDGTVSPSDRYGNDLTAVIEGVVTFRKA